MIAAVLPLASAAAGGVREPLFSSKPEDPSPPPPPPALDRPVLTYPKEVRSKDGLLDVQLDFGVVDFKSEYVNFLGRGYNGSVTGPSLHFYPGDTVKIKLCNRLSDKDNDAFNGLDPEMSDADPDAFYSYPLYGGKDDGFPYWSGTTYPIAGPVINASSVLMHNDYHDPNTTNFHTHGLHIGGSQKVSQDDDITIEVAPGACSDYEYHIPTDHMPGNHWYHAHWHGSTSLQLQGGAVGMFFVDEPEPDKYEWLSDMKEVPIMLLPLPPYFSDWVLQQSRHNKDLMQFEYSEDILKGETYPEYSSFTTDPFHGDTHKGCAFGGMTFNEAVTGAGSSPPDVDSCIMLANGQFMPKLVMETGEWYRLRITHAGILTPFWGYLDGQITYDGKEVGKCEMMLLGKDGIFVEDAPRPITRLPMPAGGRADVAIRCSEAGVYKLLGLNPDAKWVAPGVGQWTDNPNTEAGTGGWPGLDWNDGCRCSGDITDTIERNGYNESTGVCPDPNSTWPNCTCPGCPVVKPFEGDVLFFEVVDTNRRRQEAAPDKSGDKAGESARRALATLPKLNYKYPCYLVDLQNVPEDELEQLDLAFHTDGPGVMATHDFRVTTALLSPYLGVGFNTINGVAWQEDGSDPIQTLKAGKVYEIDLRGTSEHPFHLHINPFQLTKAPDTGDLDLYGGYHKAGDWHDTWASFLNLFPNFDPNDPKNAGTSDLLVGTKVRLQTDYFTGKMILHCHILLHEDLGMMVAYDISGEEGTVWEGAKEIDPTCKMTTTKGPDAPY